MTVFMWMEGEKVEEQQHNEDMLTTASRGEGLPGGLRSKFTGPILFNAVYRSLGNPDAGVLFRNGYLRRGASCFKMGRGRTRDEHTFMRVCIDTERGRAGKVPGS